MSGAARGISKLKYRISKRLGRKLNSWALSNDLRNSKAYFPFSCSMDVKIRA
jgi:hypothetical protein